MPYYAWEAVALDGKVHKGSMCARNEHDLQEQLVMAELGLMRCHKKRLRSFKKRFGRSDKAAFYKQLALLLAAGVHLYDALIILSYQIKHPVSAQIIPDVAQAMLNGQSLVDGLAEYPECFDSMSLQILVSGQESGALRSSLELLADYETLMVSFMKRIQAALWTPIITLAFFIVITLVIGTVVLPSLSTMFDTVNAELPLITRMMLGVSDAMRNMTFYMVSGILCSMLTLLIVMLNRSSYAYLIGWVMMRIPVIGSWYMDWQLMHYFACLHVLAAGNLPIVMVLQSAAQSIKNTYMKASCDQIAHSVLYGTSLKDAFTQESLFKEHVLAFIGVGESSACLALMFQKSRDLYMASLDVKLHAIATFIQPIMMILIGLLITGLIFAVYLPIFSLSHIVM